MHYEKMKPWDCWEFVIIIYNTHFLLRNGCNLVQGMGAVPPRCLKQNRPDGKWFYGFYGQGELPQWALLGLVFSDMCQHDVCMVTCHQPISWMWVLKIFNLDHLSILVWNYFYFLVLFLILLNFHLKLLIFLSQTGKTDPVVSHVHALTFFLSPL